MTVEKPWGSMNPNSQHQLWSRWEFRIYGPHKPLKELRYNVAKWIQMGFRTSAGRVKVSNKIINGRCVTIITADVEGVPANDVSYISQVRKGFNGFIHKGWGVISYGEMSVQILSGDQGNGKAPAQLIVIPTIRN